MMLERLARIADLDVEKFAMEMFKAGTSLVDKTPEEILNQDFKVFTINENKVGIAQVYTMDLDSLKDLKEDLISAMEERRIKEGYTSFILMLTDIFNEGSEMVVAGENKELIAQAFGKKLVNNSFYAPGVLSRKKQVVPPITTTISNLEEMQM